MVLVVLVLNLAVMWICLCDDSEITFEDGVFKKVLTEINTFVYSKNAKNVIQLVLRQECCSMKNEIGCAKE